MSLPASPQRLKKIGDFRDDTRKLIKGDYLDIDFPILFKQESYDGKKICDVLDTGYAGLYLISDTMQNILTENKLTGWKTYPIKLFDEKGNEIYGYSGFSVVGKCGTIYYKKETVLKKRRGFNTPLLKRYKGNFFDIETWDRTDFFTPENAFWIGTSSKAAKILMESKLTNIVASRMSEIEIPEYAILDKKLIR